MRLAELVTFAPSVAICATFVQLTPWQRSSLKPVSLVALSVQVRLMRMREGALPARLLGAAGVVGGGGVLSVTSGSAAPQSVLK